MPRPGGRCHGAATAAGLSPHRALGSGTLCLLHLSPRNPHSQNPTLLLNLTGTSVSGACFQCREGKNTAEGTLSPGPASGQSLCAASF